MKIPKFDLGNKLNFNFNCNKSNSEVLIMSQLKLSISLHLSLTKPIGSIKYIGKQHSSTYSPFKALIYLIRAYFQVNSLQIYAIF